MMDDEFEIGAAEYSTELMIVSLVLCVHQPGYSFDSSFTTDRVLLLQHRQQH